MEDVVNAGQRVQDVTGHHCRLSEAAVITRVSPSGAENSSPTARNPPPPSSIPRARALSAPIRLNRSVTALPSADSRSLLPLKLPPLPSTQSTSFKRTSPRSPPKHTRSRNFFRTRAVSTATSSQTVPIEPPLPLPMSVSSLSRSSPKTQHRFDGLNVSSSGIPVLKTRVRVASPRSPSPELVVSRTSLTSERPPFRVDLDGALAEIEDELEARAAEHYALASPATPSSSPRLPYSTTKGTVTGSSRRLRSGPTSPETQNIDINRLPHAIRADSAASLRKASQSSPTQLSTPKSIGRTRRQASSPPGSGFSTRSVSSTLVTPSSNLTPSRLGVAAHFIPPESNYTPPKGADWDDVVLPTVAKKLGIPLIGDGSLGHADEGDLAVEWDKDGTPIKWRRAGRDMSNGDTTTPRSFSPISDTSPNKPLDSDNTSCTPLPTRPADVQLTIERQPPVQSSTAASHRSPHRSRSNELRGLLPERIELSPLRTSEGQVTDLPSAHSPSPLNTYTPLYHTRSSLLDPRPAPAPPHQASIQLHHPTRDPSSYTSHFSTHPGATSHKRTRDETEVKGCSCVIM